MHRNANSYDALVVGARAAGAATAMLMARAGMRVLVVDWEEQGSDTISTHALMRSAVMQLARWGLAERLRGAGTPDVTETLFSYAGDEVHVPIRPAYGVPGLLAPRRRLLDATLADAAWAAGAEIRYRTAFRDVLCDSGHITGAVLSDANGHRYEVRTGLVIGADGRRSTVARRVRAQVLRKAPTSVASVYAYVEGIENRGYRWYYAPGLGAGLIPTNDGAHCVFAAETPMRLRARLRNGTAAESLQALCNATDPELGAIVRDSSPVSKPVVFGGLPGYIRQAAGPGWALVGDAGYFKDPLTAHGITDAFRDAECLSRAAIRGEDTALVDYSATRDVLSAEFFQITCDIARLDMPMDALKAAHVRLNAAMKAEQSWMAEAFGPLQKAA